MRVTFLPACVASLTFPFGSAKAAETRWVRSIPEAKEDDSSPFSMLAQTAADTDPQCTRPDVQANGEKFQKLVAVTVILERISASSEFNSTGPLLRGPPTDGIFARDIAKSVLRAALSAAKRRGLST